MKMAKPLESIKSGKMEIAIWASNNPQFSPQVAIRKSWKGTDGAYKTSPKEGAMYIGLEDLASLFIMLPEARSRLQRQIAAHKQAQPAQPDGSGAPENWS